MDTHFCKCVQQHYGRIGIISLKKDTFLSFKDVKGHFDQKYSFKGLFEIKDACTYTAPYIKLLPRTFYFDNQQTGRTQIVWVVYHPLNRLVSHSTRNRMHAHFQATASFPLISLANQVGLKVAAAARQMQRRICLRPMKRRPTR